MQEPTPTFPIRTHLTIIVVAVVFYQTVYSHAQDQSGAYKDVAFTGFFRRTSGWVAGDGAFSVPLSDGRVLWVFGDSHVDDLDPATGTMACLFQVRNAGMLQDAKAGQASRLAQQGNAATNSFQATRTLIGHGPGFRSWFKNSTNEDLWFWPLCGFHNDATVYVYLNAFRKRGKSGKWDFKLTGHDSWAKVSFPGMDSVSYSELPSLNGISFGFGFVKDGPYTYAFGSKQRGPAGDLYVGRFPSAQPEREWSFWTGHGWDANPTNSAAIARGTSTSLHVCKVRDRFLLTTSAVSLDCDGGKEIFMATSATPTGPFSALKSVFTLDDTVQGHYPFFYLPVAHPEFINDRNELLVTYSINGYEPCIPFCINGRAIADQYRPRAIRVPLRLLE